VSRQEKAEVKRERRRARGPGFSSVGEKTATRWGGRAPRGEDAPSPNRSALGLLALMAAAGNRALSVVPLRARPAQAPDVARHRGGAR
jgi:hypothetical protein